MDSRLGTTALFVIFKRVLDSEILFALYFDIIQSPGELQTISFTLENGALLLPSLRIKSVMGSFDLPNPPPSPTDLEFN